MKQKYSNYTLFILTHTKESAMAKVVVGSLNQGCGVEAIFSDSTSLEFYDSKSNSTSLRFYDCNSESRIPTKNNSDSRISEKTTPTPNSSTFKNTTPTPASLIKQLHPKMCDSNSTTLVMSHFLKSEGKPTFF